MAQPNFVQVFAGFNEAHRGLILDFIGASETEAELDAFEPPAEQRIATASDMANSSQADPTS